MHGRIGNDPASSVGFQASGLELGLDQRQESTGRIQQFNRRGEDAAQGDKRAVDDDEVGVIEGWREGGTGEVAGVDPFHDCHARVAAQAPGQLTATDIHSVDPGRPMLEEAIGEASGGGSEVDGDKTLDVELEMAERVFEFDAAAADVTFGGEEIDLILRSGGSAGFVGDLMIELDEAGEDEAAGLFATGAEAAGDEGLVQPLWGRPGRDG